MFDSSFFDTSSHGVGGWGDPNNDFQISTGSFKDVIRAYPIPHHIRRNYTIRPYLGDPNAPADLQSYMINQTMTKEALDYVLTSFDGDFLSFDAFLESVSLLSVFCSSVCLTYPYRRIMPALTLSSAGERIVASGSLSPPTSVTYEFA